MTMTTLKNAGNWDLLGEFFNIQGNILERTVISFIHLAERVLNEVFMSKWEQKKTMSKLKQDKILFQYHRYLFTLQP